MVRTTVARTMVGTMTDRQERRGNVALAPIEPGATVPAADRRRPDPKPFQRAWGAAGAAASSALLAAIVGPMVTAAGNSGLSLSAQPSESTVGSVTGGSSGGAITAAPSPHYVYLQPGESAPAGAPVVRLDPINVVASPQPGSSVVKPKPKRQVIYIYLQPGQTPPPGAIVQIAGSVTKSTPAPTVSSSASQGSGTSSGGSSGGLNGGGTTPKPSTAATPTPATPSPTPVATLRPTPAPVPPPTTPSGAKP